MSNGFMNLNGLKISIGRENPREAKDILANIDKFFDEGLSKSELENALQVVFNVENGTVKFLNATINKRKLFKDCNVMVFDLWIKIIQFLSKELKIDAYVPDIIECCMKYISSNMVSAKEREKATIVIQEIFRNDLSQNIDVPVMLSKLLEVLSMKSLTEIFMQQVFKLLGIISKTSSTNITSLNAIEIREHFMKAIEDILMKEEEMKFKSLTGAVEGLDFFLINFTSICEESKIRDQIYGCIKKLSDPPPNSTQKAIYRAALSLFTRHSKLFSNQIFMDFSHWHTCLLKWTSSKQYEDRRTGIYATHSFHSIIATEIFIRKEQNDNKILSMLEFLMKHFRFILESPKSQPYETRIAIRGFGLVSGSCKCLLPAMLQDFLSLVVQRTELISTAQDSELKDSLEHFPDYIEALSQMVSQIGDQHTDQILSLVIQNIMIRLFKDFHYLSRAHTGLTVSSLSAAFVNISDIGGSFLEQIMEKIVLQGVVWTCSHKLTYDAFLDWDTVTDWKENITYKNYMPLWEGLLENSDSISSKKQLIIRQIFNNLISTLFIILDKLNLSTKRRTFRDEEGKDQEFFFCDPNIDLCPVKPSDFHIFFNLVEFYRDIFRSKYPTELFQDWINEYCFKMMKFAAKNPLVSGFLKLLEIGLKSGDNLQHFQEETTEETKLLQRELSYFLKNMITKSQKTSGELQISCLQLILKYPVVFYKDYILDLIPIFQMALTLGQSTLWIAKLSIGKLEQISNRFFDSPNDMKKFYEKVLPHLDNYLLSKGLTVDTNNEIIKNKNGKRIRKRQIGNITESDLLEIQRRIFSFLGKMDPQNAILVASIEPKESLVKWNFEQNIRLPFYFQNIRPEIYLDTIVPRICHLATTSSDRKSKIAACELIHTIVLYLLGTRNHNGQMWKELCSRTLILGADGDATVQQMFEPLLMQIMHFMSKYENLNRGVDILIESLMEGISNHDNMTIRDLSAACLREFVEWSIKQSTPEQLKASPASIEMILRQLKIYSNDSNVGKRIGAALAFNNLYRQLRGTESICDVFFVDLLYTFCINFKLTEHFSVVSIDNLNPDLEQVSQSLDHIIRVLRERNDLYNKSSARRQLPIDFQTGTLIEIVLFLIKESSINHIRYRRKCMEMAETLSYRIDGVSSFSEFLQKFIGQDLLLEICEGTKNGTGIMAYPNLNHIKNIRLMPHTHVYSWLQYFLSSLECYYWLMGDHALKNPQLLFSGSTIFSVLSYYLQNVCWSSEYDILTQINCDFMDTSSDTVMMAGIEEISKIESLKCVIVIKIMDFISKVLQVGCATKIPKSFWMDNKKMLIKLITQTIYQPQYLNFDSQTNAMIEKLPESIKNFIIKLYANCPDHSFVDELKLELMKFLKERLYQLTNSVKEILSSNAIPRNQLKIIQGIEFSCKNLHLITQIEVGKMFVEASAQRLTCDLFTGLKQKNFGKFSTVSIPPEVKKFANQLMRICFIIGDFSREIVNYILEDTELLITGVSDTNGNIKIKHGEYFFNMYRKTIFQYSTSSILEHLLQGLLQKINETNFTYVTKILIELTEYIHKNRKLEISISETLVNVILNNLQRILIYYIEPTKDILFIELMSILALVSPYPIITFKARAPVLEEWILFRLRYDKNTLEHKSRVITLLPLLIGPNDVQYEPVTQALEELQRQNFPIKSSEFSKNSLEETGLRSAYKSLLSALINSGSFVILDFIIKSTASDPEHILEWMIKDEIRVFGNNLNQTQQLDCLNNVFALVNNNNYEPCIRCTVLNRFLVIIIQVMGEEILEKFFVIHIKDIKKLTESNYGFAKDGLDVEQALVDRIVGFTMLELMSGCLPKEMIADKMCPIGVALLNEMETPAQLVGILSRQSYYARSEVFVTDNKSVKEFFRLYQCAAYRATCSLICNTQTDMKFYNMLIFEEKPDKGEFIWRRTIDCSEDKKYVFKGQEFEYYPRVKDRFVSIRKLNPRPFVGNHLFTTSKYLQTQNIFNSSLSQDISNIDLNYSNVRNDAEVLNAMEKRHREIVTVSLERNDLNKHELMPILCGVINHMMDSKIVEPSENPAIRRTYPWVKAIKDAILNPEHQRNIRLFLAQLVDNCRNVFQNFAIILFHPILDVVVEEASGDDLNFFVTDLTALLLSWTSKKLYQPSTSEEKHLASTLLKLLMKNAWNEKKEIFKYNLELIQAVITLWKDFLTIPYQLLLDMITKTQQVNSKDNICGVTLVAIVLSNNIIPWTEVSRIHFIRGIFINLNNENSIVYQPAARAMGFILATLKNIENGKHCKDLQIELTTKLKLLYKKKDKHFTDILFGIQKNYPEILCEFNEIISFKIPQAIGAIKRIYLEMFLNSLDTFEMEDVYNNMISVGIKDLLKNTEYQLLALHIVNRALPKLNANSIKNLLPMMEECLELRRSDCRDVAYEILIFINLNFDKTLDVDVTQYLIKGLNDPDSQVQKRVFNFWSEESNIPEAITDRIVALLSDYSVNCEKQFLGFCTQLILQAAIKNPESKRQIFTFETDRDSKLIEYNINTNYRMKSTYTMPPLFADSQQLKHTVRSGSLVSSLLRETVTDYVFEPTQDPIKMSQSRENFTLSTQSSLPFGIQPEILDRRSQKIHNEKRFMDELDIDKSMMNFRKRFLKDKERENREKALKIIDANTRRIELAKRDRKMKEGQVVLYRRYRFGDYPDLLIDSLALLMPMQALVQRDPVIARQVFVSIFNGIVNEIGEDVFAFSSLVGSKIQLILENCKTCEPTIFATFLEIALLQPKHFNFDPETIAMLAKGTKMLTVAALYLENRLEDDWDSEPSTSKTTSTTRPEEEHWVYLSDIYNSLADYDIVAAIFTDKLGTDPRLAKAIELKANGNFETARQLLLEVINRKIHTEHYYSYNAYAECYQELTDWSQLSQLVKQQVDSVEELWTDEYNLNFLLPKLMQAELHLILDGSRSNEVFLEDVYCWMQDPAIGPHLKSTFCEELMMLEITNKDYLQARVFGENYMKSFLVDWSIMNTLYYKLRRECLLNAQKVSEIDRYAQILHQNLNEKSVEKLRNQWNNCKINPSDSLKFWYCVTAYRTYVGSLIIDAMDNLDDIDITASLSDAISDMKFKVFDAAIYQQNSGVANNILGQLSPLAGSNNHGLQYEIATVKRTMLNGLRSKELRALDYMEQACIKSGKLLRNEQIKSSVPNTILVLNLYAETTQEILKLSLNVIINNSRKEDLMNLINNSNSREFHQRFFDETLWALQKGADLAQSAIIDSETSLTRIKATCKSYYKLAQFCYDYHDKNTINRSTDLEKILITAIFQAMNYGSTEARQLFPCILQLPSIENGTLQEHFQHSISEVADWMFLPWISQIFSRLQYNRSCYLDDLILRIAKSYPSAVKYHFTLWYERLQNTNYSEEHIRQSIKELEDLLKDPITDQFIKNMKVLCIPECFLLAHLEDLLKQLLNKASNAQKIYEKIIDRFIEIVFDENYVVRGTLYRNIRKYKTTFVKLRSFSYAEKKKEIDTTLRELVANLRKILKKFSDTNVMQLNEICPWLSQYQWCGKDTFLEIPGQYTGKKPPFVNEHVKIVKFGQSVTVMKSMRYPLKLSINGSNGKKYDFLVKHGEDLTQDQRVQQILELMSEKLAKDRNCRLYNLMINTYQVTPIDLCSGMLAWVQDTTELREFIIKCLSRRDLNYKTTVINAATKYINFIKRATRENNTEDFMHIYGKAAATNSIDQLIANFRNIETIIEPNILKDALVEISVSPESYFVLRNNFARSLAIMNISNWIIGTGDRHLKNILVSIKDGSLTGIDFNVVFGGGIRYIPVPEMVPFRLTPHLVQMMSPLGTSGVIFKSMVHGLTVFKQNKRVLMACLQVFVRDPAIDWSYSSRGQLGERNVKDTPNWEPMDRLDVVRCKLDGYNPLNLMERDMKRSLISKFPEYYKGYLKILRGREQFNIRARLPEKNLTVENQVNCLIDLATDRGILGITYDGFEPWL